MRSLTRVIVTLAVVAASLHGVRADGPITAAQCSIINPNPIVTSCSYYLPPIVDLYGNLPYDTVAEYTNCVKERCVCTGAAVNTSITTDGLYCNESGWMESGYTTCNVFNNCFTRFWFCINKAVMNRANTVPTLLTNGEADLSTELSMHGRLPGEPFKVTDAYRSCRLKMCAAAASRENCGLVTCLPNYTQCDQYMLPPPLPYTHQLCTQGCRAMLLMMAMTIAVVSLSVGCIACCPAPVHISEPVIKREPTAVEEESGEQKEEGESGSRAPDSQQSGSQQQRDSQARSNGSGSHHENDSQTHTNHNSHRSNASSRTNPHAVSNAEAQQRGNDPF